MNEFMQELKVLCEEAAVKLKEIRERMSALDQSLVDEPQLIQGYTAAQWSEIIDGGYLCEFGISGSKDLSRFGTLSSKDLSLFTDEHDRNWQFCRPAQLKGVMRPIFVGANGGAKCMFFNEHSEPLGCILWSDIPIFSKIDRATKYIEL